MIILPSAAQLHLARESRRITICGLVKKNDDTFVRCTQSDIDIEVDTGDLAGTYFSTTAVTASDMQSASDLSVDNLEITGGLQDGLSFTGFSAQDVEAGLFNNAPFQMFLCQWDKPSAWQKVTRRGYMGQITRTSEGSFTAEWRGLTQLMSQNIGRFAGENCDVYRFGDSRCKLNVQAMAGIGVVTGAIDRRSFQVAVTWPGGGPGGANPAPGYADLGELQFTTGQNSPYLTQVMFDQVGSPSAIQLWEALPYDVRPGDAFRVTPGCDRRYETCQFFNNTVNFRGPGRWSPGIPKIIRAP